MLLQGNRRFLDIGCNDPVTQSNTYMLERKGWTGICIDALMFDYSCRTSQFIQGEAVDVLSRPSLKGEAFDYISVDVDNSSADAVQAMLINGISFLFATVEHDKYACGYYFQNRQHRVLSAAGYVPMFIDIAVPEPWPQDHYFEDWWCSRLLCDRTLGVGFKSKHALEEIQKFTQSL